MVRPAALVTGAAGRIGAAFVRALAQDGYDVALHFRSSRGGAERTAEAARVHGGRVELVAADLADPVARGGLVGEARARFGRLDVLVNNASLFAYDDLATLEEPLWREHLEVNLTAPVFLIRDFARALARDGAGDGVRDGARDGVGYGAEPGPGAPGVVVNLLDQKVARPNPDFLSYTAARMGLAGLTAPLALALAPNIRVAGIAPGLTLPSQLHPDGDFAAAQASAPLRLGPTPDDLVSALRFILRTPAFTGQVITVDAGESLVGRPRDVAFDAGRYD